MHNLNDMDFVQIYAKMHGFKGAIYLGELDGEKVYQPDRGSDDILFGRPSFIHVKGMRIRASKDREEASKVMHHFF